MNSPSNNPIDLAPGSRTSPQVPQNFIPPLLSPPLPPILPLEPLPYSTLVPGPEPVTSMSFVTETFEDRFNVLGNCEIDNTQSIAPSRLTIGVASDPEIATSALYPAFQDELDQQQQQQQQQQQHENQQIFATQDCEEKAYLQTDNYAGFLGEHGSPHSQSPLNSSSGGFWYIEPPRLPSLFDYSQSFASWGVAAGTRESYSALTALELLMPKVGRGASAPGDIDMADYNMAGYATMTKRKVRFIPPLVVSSSDKPFRCSMGAGCKARFKRQEHLRRHEMTHTDQKPFTCTICGRGFGRNDNLQTHKRTHMKSNGRNVYAPELA